MLLSIYSGSDRLSAASVKIADNVRNARGDARTISDTMSQMSASMEETAASINHINELVLDIAEEFDDIATEIGELANNSQAAAAGVQTETVHL